MIIDFFSLAGAWVDSCEAGQVAMLLPILRTLYGEVTMTERGAVADEPEQSFADWLDSLTEIA